MRKKDNTAVAIFVGAVVFLALEVAVYYGLVTWLVPTDPEVEEQGGSIVRNWNKVMYFILIYMGVLVGALLFASSQVPRSYRRHVLFWFYLSLPTLLVLLVLAFS
ncbi:hypothetical protein ACD591_13160 [Rufibacter glacialis]|uniref:Uncharacterized protein n=1 Tax=Rufibacter glacialis TaxID=1259555 RepID=A0A5M8Q7G1_9BACT|nr:hypothetical protein [Rufibacter glacialis]KAA6431193.1 hypothetical protein FOE74_19070 [Rufibacter glacialis]GGK84834.1 hypothetical protein GCM10011405_35920 [Rufibacter glacialis]